jgi:hypothetical protein
MPPEPFIGSFTTKTMLQTRNDIDIVSINPQIPFPASRLSLRCQALLVGQVIWEVWNQPQNDYLPMLGIPPYQLITEGSMFLPPVPAHPIPIILAPGGQFNLLPANWHNNCYIEIIPAYLRFRYTPRATNQNPNPAPILFRRLRFLPQIQSSIRAEGL